MPFHSLTFDPTDILETSMFKPFFPSLSFALLCAPIVGMAQPAPADVTLPADVPAVMTTQVMQARIEKLSLDLKAIGAYLTVGPDGRLGCACGGTPTVPNLRGPGPRPPLDTQHLIRGLEALQLVLNNERNGLNTTIYATQLPKAAGATALPH